MGSKIFLDANICLDFLLQRKGFEAADAIFERIIRREVKACITPAIVHIIAYFSKKIHSVDTVKKILLKLLLHVEVIECSHEVTITAIASAMPDIEDALQYYTAIHHKVDYFVSHDKGLKKEAIPVLPVYSPDEFLGLFYN